MNNVILTTEQAQQIEEALELAIRTSLNIDNNSKFEAALSTIHAAGAQEQAGALWIDGIAMKPSDMEAIAKTWLATQVEQKPVAWASFDNAYSKACNSSNPQDWMEAALLAQQIRTAHVRTKDLTDDEIVKTAKWTGVFETKIGYEFGHGDLLDFARAVIAADREKNK